MTTSSKLHDLLGAIVRETKNEGDESQIEFVKNILEGAKKTPGVDLGGSEGIIQPYIDKLQSHLEKL